MKSSLVLMAAGLGSRFGGTKQLVPVGKSGETLLDFTIQDALRVGITDVVIIVRSEIVNDMKSHVERLHPCLLYTSPSPRDRQKSRMPSSA